MIDDDSADAMRRLSVPSTGPGGMSRRRFLQALGIGAGAVTAGPMLARLGAFAGPALQPGNGILVLVMMSGGNDGLNTVIPYGDPKYYQRRSDLAYTANQVLPVGNSPGSGVAVGLHPSLVKTKARFDAKHVAVIQGAGYKYDDLSHFTSMGYWMQGWRDTPSASNGTVVNVGTGWIGRYLDELVSDNPSLSGTLLCATIGSSVPLHLVGSTQRGVGLPESSAGGLSDLASSTDATNELAFSTIGSFASRPTQLGTWGDSFASSERQTTGLLTKISPAYGGTLPNTDIGHQLVLSARLINADLGLRVLSAEIGGFDNHSHERAEHASLLSDLDDALDAFFTTLDPRFVPNVVIMTFSEFGRRPDENGTQGTDHGSAAPMLVMGQGVKGGLYGQYPSLTSLDDDDNLKPNVDFRNVYSDILGTWMGADAGAIIGTTYPQLGFLGAAPPPPPPPRVHRQRRPRAKVG